MEFKGTLADVSRDWKTGKARVTFEVTEMESGAFETAVNAISGSALRVTAVKYRKKRSLDANAYAWVLMQKLAEAAHTDKDTIYLECLKRYSRAFTHIIVKPQAVEAVKAMYRACEDLGEISVGDMTGHQLRVYYGSSTFDTKEMSVFIDGIVSECKECGIETLTPHQLDQMKGAWK